MCKTVLVASFGASVAFVIAALAATLTVERGMGHWPAAWCVSAWARRHLWAIQIRNDWRCTYWTKEKQIEIKVWFDDQLSAQEYRLECNAQVNEEKISFSDRNLGGTYAGRGGLTRGPPHMVEFRGFDVVLAKPQRAVISIRIQPNSPWGSTRKETRTIPVTVIDRTEPASQSEPDAS